MLSVGEAISYGLRFDVSQGSASVDSDQPLRDKALFNLNKVCKFVHNSAPVWWRLFGGSSTIAIPGGTGIGTMPTLFERFGKDGNVYLTPGQFGQQLMPPLQPLGPQQLIEWQRMNQFPTQWPTNYTLLGLTPAGLKQIQVFPVNQGNVNLDITGYVLRAPDLLDRPGPPTVVVNGAGVLTGIYQWATTYINTLGETEVGPLSPPLTLTAQQVTVTPAVSANRSATSRNVYRTTTGQGLPTKLSGTVAGNFPWTTYADNVADGSLGVPGPTPATAITGLEQFTQDWHEWLIVDGLCAYLRDVQGDLRGRDGGTPTSVEQFEKNVIRMWAEEKQGQNAVRLMGRYPGARRQMGSGRRRFYTLQ